jgi:hypothetical protein
MEAMATINKKDPQVLQRELMKKEAALELAFKTQVGLQKLAQALASPVRKHLDYRGIGRRLFVTEPYVDPGPMYYDADIAEFDAVMIGRDGTSRMVVVRATRTILPEFEVAVRVKIPFAEVRTRKYKVVERAKERLKQSFAIREDLLIFSLVHDAVIASNQLITATGTLIKEDLAEAFWRVENRRLIPLNVLISPASAYAIRNWERDQIEETARIEIRRTGYLGVLWGANFLVSQLIKKVNIGGTDYNVAYVLPDPQFVGWYPIRADVEVIPADTPDLLLLGFVGYLQAGMILHNIWAVAGVAFTQP